MTEHTEKKDRPATDLVTALVEHCEREHMTIGNRRCCIELVEQFLRSHLSVVEKERDEAKADNAAVEEENDRLCNGLATAYQRYVAAESKLQSQTEKLEELKKRLLTLPRYTEQAIARRSSMDEYISISALLSEAPSGLQTEKDKEKT